MNPFFIGLFLLSTFVIVAMAAAAESTIGSSPIQSKKGQTKEEEKEEDCGPNASWKNGTVPCCRWTCRSGPTCACVKQGGCECDEGYLFDDEETKKCVPREDCPQNKKNKQCIDPNSEFVRSVPCCAPTCKVPKPNCKCFVAPPPGCTCKRGFVLPGDGEQNNSSSSNSRGGGRCVPISDCPIQTN